MHPLYYYSCALFSSAHIEEILKLLFAFLYFFHFLMECVGDGGVFFGLLATWLVLLDFFVCLLCVQRVFLQFCEFCLYVLLLMFLFITKIYNVLQKTFRLSLGSFCLFVYHIVCDLIFLVLVSSSSSRYHFKILILFYLFSLNKPVHNLVLNSTSICSIRLVSSFLSSHFLNPQTK